MSFRNYYDTTSYGRSRDTGRSSSISSVTTDRPTSVTAKYINTTPSYKSSSIPILNPERKDESPISTIASRYANYGKNDKTVPKYEKKDYSKLTVPSVTKSRDVSPVSSSSKYSYNRPSRHLSPERRTTKSYKAKSRDPSPTDRDKDIPSKTDKASTYSSLSSYKLYPRASNYTRPSSRTETKPEVSVNRYAIANRLSSNYLRSPPTVKRTSVSPINHTDTIKSETEKPTSPSIIVQDVNHVSHMETVPENIQNENNIEKRDANESNDENNLETVTVITRHTSPTPPGSSAYVRSRRAEMAKTTEKSITRLKKRPQMLDKEVQSDRLDDPTRTSRFGSTSRATTTNWTYYSPNSYTGYAGRYSTQYSTLRESASNNSCNDRSSRSHSREPPPRDSNNSSPFNNTNGKSISLTNSTGNNQTNDSNQEIVAVYEHNKDDDTSEIIINVNLKLKRAKSPLAAAAELVSPELTITNSSQLPPLAPKTEGTTKVKKTKVRKSSTDSSSDSTSKKKIVKKRSKSVSSTDSDQTNESSDKQKNSSASSPKSNQKKSSTSNMQNGHQKLKHSKSRESNSPESSITLSTQSSISEDDSISKSKTQDVSRTSADEISIPTDKSGKQSSPAKNEGGTEEAKSFLIRALAPVTNLFKMRNQDPSDNSRWPENSTSESTGKDVSNLITESDKSSKSKNIIASNEDNLVQLKAIRHIESGERAWWLDSESDKKNKTTSSDNQTSDKKICKKIKRVESGEKAWWLESNTENEKTSETNHVDNSEHNKSGAKFQPLDDEKPWWLDSSANVPEGVERLSPPRKSSSDSEKSEKYNFYKVRHIESGDTKDWWLTSNENSSQSNIPDGQNRLSKSGSDQKSFPLRRIRHVESGERPWWLSSGKNIPEGIEKLPTPPPKDDSESSDSEEVEVYAPPAAVPPFPLHLPDDEPLGDRRSPEGVETPQNNEDYRGRTSPYENNRQFRRRQSAYPKNMDRFISRYTDIDDILGTSSQIYSPFMDSILARRTGQIPYDGDDDECREIDPTQVRIHDSTAQRPVIKKLRCRSEIIDYRDEDQLDDATLQVFKDGDYGPYLDLDSTLGEQDEELEGLQDNRKNSLVLRTQLLVRVHAIIERLLNAQGRDLRRALFSLKQILQTDKDFVHEFVANKGLDCLMQVSKMEQQNYIDYTLRALGQILLYVDGMHGVMAHLGCIKWLYSLILSAHRHVVKTTLKLLVIFVEYSESNSLLLIEAVKAVDQPLRRRAWYNVMKILQDVDASDTELLIYATTLINACLNKIPDRDTYYDQVDALQEQGMDEIIQLYMSKQGTDLDLLRQLQIFSAVLQHEDGDETGTALKLLDESIISTVRRRSIHLNTADRRKSKQQQMKEKAKSPETDKITNNHRSQFLPAIVDNKDCLDFRTDLRRRRFVRQAHHIRHQEELLNDPVKNGVYSNGISQYTNGHNGHHDENSYSLRIPVKSGSSADVYMNGNQRYTTGLKQRIQNGTLGHSVNGVDALAAIRQKQLENSAEAKDDREILLNREHSIKELAQRLTSAVSLTTEEKPLRVAEMAGIVSKAKEELAKSQSKVSEIVKIPSIEKVPKVTHEIKVSENDLHWEELRKSASERPFHLCDLDFSELRQDSDHDMRSLASTAPSCPPPPPPNMLFAGPPPPLPNSFQTSHRNNIPAPPPKPSFTNEQSQNSDSSTIKKNKKTVKLFWREIQDNPIPLNFRSEVDGCIWDDLPEIAIDTNVLEHLFESRTNDLNIKKLSEPKRNLVLDAKRSNAINIAMKKLPTPQSIKAAIMKMDSTVISREGIEKLLAILPTEEEKIKIQEAQYANPDLPLGSAEQFLLTFSINELSSRLKLWVFKLDFDNLEKEIAEPLMDLMQGIQLLKNNKTFKVILSTLRTVGSFLNGNQVKGFRLDYLSKVTEVKDINKHPLLYHICETIIKKFPDTTDLFSEVGPVIRASKVDFDMLSTNLDRLEADCKAAWDHLKKIAKHDPQIFKTKINEFLTDAAERIILLTEIKKRVMSRFDKFLMYLLVPPADVSKTKASEFLKVIAEFALEYRTTRERVLQQLEKKANHRERNKTRGKMIIDVSNYASKNGDHSADSALKELLKTDADSLSLTDSRRKPSMRPPLIQTNCIDMSPDEKIIESLVRSATSKRKPVQRERRKNRLSNKMSWNRTLDGHQSWPGRETSVGCNEKTESNMCEGAEGCAK